MRFTDSCSNYNTRPQRTRTKVPALATDSTEHVTGHSSDLKSVAQKIEGSNPIRPTAIHLTNLQVS